jgi:hypothetical protein
MSNANGDVVAFDSASVYLRKLSASSTSSMTANAEQQLQPPDNKYLEARWDEDGHM